MDLVVRLGERGLQRRLDRAADQHGLRARMLKHIGEIVGGQQRIDRNRDDPRQHGAQEGHRPVGAVLHEDQRALLALDASLLKRGGEPTNALIELSEGHDADVVDERRFGWAPRIGLKQMRREVERLRRRFNGAPGHRRLPSRRRSRLGDSSGTRSGVSKLAGLGLMQYYASFGLRGGFRPCQTPYRLRPLLPTSLGLVECVI